MLFKVEESWKKDNFYGELKNQWYMHGIDDSVVCMGDYWICGCAY